MTKTILDFQQLPNKVELLLSSISLTEKFTWRHPSRNIEMLYTAPNKKLLPLTAISRKTATSYEVHENLIQLLKGYTDITVELDGKHVNESGRKQEIQGKKSEASIQLTSLLEWWTGIHLGWLSLSLNQNIS